VGYQLSGFINFQTIRGFEPERNPVRVNSGAYDKIVFEARLITVINQVNSGIKPDDTSLCQMPGLQCANVWDRCQQNS